MFRVSQHPSSGVLKTVTAATSTGHNIGTATSLQRGLQATLEGSSCTCTGGCGYSFITPDDGCCDTRNMYSNLAVNKYLHTVASRWIFIINFKFTLSFSVLLSLFSLSTFRSPFVCFIYLYLFSSSLFLFFFSFTFFFCFSKNSFFLFPPPLPRFIVFHFLYLLPSLLLQCFPLPSVFTSLLLTSFLAVSVSTSFMRHFLSGLHSVSLRATSWLTPQSKDYLRPWQTDIPGTQTITRLPPNSGDTLCTSVASLSVVTELVVFPSISQHLEVSNLSKPCVKTLPSYSQLKDFSVTKMNRLYV